MVDSSAQVTKTTTDVASMILQKATEAPGGTIHRNASIIALPAIIATSITAMISKVEADVSTLEVFQI